jgi:hypothetical protein
MKKLQYPSMGKTELMQYRQTNGFGSTSLHDALAKEHGDPQGAGYTDPSNKGISTAIKAGGPGSGRKPGFGDKLHSLDERVKAYMKTWDPKELDKESFDPSKLPDDYAGEV